MKTEAEIKNIKSHIDPQDTTKIMEAYEEVKGKMDELSDEIQARMADMAQLPKDLANMDMTETDEGSDGDSREAGTGARSVLHGRNKEGRRQDERKNERHRHDAAQGTRLRHERQR